MATYLFIIPLFTRDYMNTRGYPLKLFKPFSINAVRQHFQDWNALPFSVVGAVPEPRDFIMVRSF